MQRVLTLMAIAIASSAANASAAVRYRIDEIVAPAPISTQESYAQGIDNNGNVTGHIFAVGDNTIDDLRFIWNPQGIRLFDQTRELDFLAATNPPYALTTHRGQSSVWHNGQVTPLTPQLYAGEYYTGPQAVNENGHVVGYGLRLSDEAQIPLVWNDAIASALPTLGGNAAARSINAHGQIVGWAADTAGKGRAVFWDGQGVHDLGVPRTYSQATVVNDSGLIAGTFWEEPDTSGAFTWLDGVITILPSLGDLSASIWDLNEAGDIVGSSAGLAALWSQGAVYNLTDLIPSDSGWFLNEATGINDSGQIAGWGEKDGMPRAFVLTPVTVPEPTTLSFGIAGCIIATRRPRPRR